MASTVATSERLEARITAEQKALFREAATVAGVTLTDFVISSVQQAALRTLEERNLVHLTRNDRRAFVQAMLSPARPPARLRAAWRRHPETSAKVSSSKRARSR
ncbi:MAG: DUF1778 domain-containing protein [Vicinamibacterales bacterium]